MQYTSVTDLRWIDAAQTLLDCIVMVGGESLPYTASATDSAAHSREIFARALDGEFGPIAPFAEVLPTLEDLRAAKLAELADRRWQAETGGTTVAGTPIKTDAESTGKITAAYVRASANPAFTVRWKVDTGVFVTLDAATIIAIGDAVTAHVQACFDMEDTLTTAILAAEDAAALGDIDIEAGWPG